MNIDKIKEKVITALKIREEIQNIFKKYNVRTSYCTENSNPFYNQIDENSEGFICEYYYDSPAKIYTPLGYIDIWERGMIGDENRDKAVKEIEDTFGFVLKEKAPNTSNGVFGAWYHITRLPWNNTNLKCDCVERDRKDYIEYDQVKKLYNQIICV